MQHLPDLGLVAEDRLDRKVFVMEPQYRLDDVRERPVADVMQEGSHTYRGLVLGRDRIRISPSLARVRVARWNAPRL